MIDQASAVRKGLEPSTLGVTGRYSNQLNYRTSFVRWDCKGNQFSINCKSLIAKFYFFYDRKKDARS